MIAIVEYNAGNVQSVQFALQRLGVEAIITGNEEEIKRADKVIFPGVGHAQTAMDYLRAHDLDKVVGSLTQPVLGICLGMQLLCKSSEEGNTTCIGIFDATVKRFESATEKIPQVGWNNIYDYKSLLFDGLEPKAFVYSVHSYYVPVSNDTVAETNYIYPYSAALQKDNFYAVQFHPEKSGRVGETILKNFISLP